MKFLITVLLVLGLATPVFAQQSLSPEEKLKLENLALLQKIAQLTQEVAQWRQLFANTAQRLGEFEVAVQQEQNRLSQERVIKEIEAARPGFVFDPFTGAFTPKEKKE